MRKLRHIARRALFLPLPLVPLLDLPVALLLIQCLRTGETGVIAHAAYLLATWALSVTILAGVRLAPRLRRSKPAVVLGASIVGNVLRNDAVLSTKLALYAGMAFNLCYAAVKLIAGIACRSVWLLSLGLYYLALGYVRYFILRADRRSPIGRSREQDLRRCRLCGVILLLLNQLLVGVVVQAARSPGRFNYPGALIYAMALYAFAANVNAAVKLVRYYRRHSPLLVAAKAVAMTAAMVSMLSLEVALVDRFGRDTVFRQHMTGVLGGFVCAAELTIALSMIARTTKGLKRLRSGGSTPG